MAARNSPRPFVASEWPGEGLSEAGVAEAVAKAKARAVELAKDKAVVESLVGYIDLTTLAGDDTKGRVSKLYARALRPLEAKGSLHCGAVCVYPARLPDVVAEKTRLDTGQEKPKVASVAAGFPAGQIPLECKLLEVKMAVAAGAEEIDIVISRNLALDGHWDQLYEEVSQLRSQCGAAHLKTILAVGELGTARNVFLASAASMCAGSDFIKTSTGKEAKNANLEDSAVMLAAVKEFHARTGTKVGFKPAGGIRTVSEALEYVGLVEGLVGPEWLTPRLFRIGASSLLDSVLKAL